MSRQIGLVIAYQKILEFSTADNQYCSNMDSGAIIRYYYLQQWLKELINQILVAEPKRTVF